MFKWSVWQPAQPLVADCLRAPWVVDRLRRRRRHPAPDPRCECGICGAELTLLDASLSAADAHSELGTEGERRLARAFTSHRGERRRLQRILRDLESG